MTPEERMQVEKIFSEACELDLQTEPYAGVTDSLIASSWSVGGNRAGSYPSYA